MAQQENKRFISIDNALKVSGYCVWENKKPLNWGTFKTTNSFPIERRLGEIWEHLNKLYAENEFTHLVFEDCQQQANVQTYHKLSMVKAAILLWCYFNDIPYSIFSPSAWRSTCGGGYGRKREEQKQSAIDKTKEWFNIEADSDTCDAINIGYAYILEKDNKEEILF
jgi:Holliday junction resolvasome RuvABC endonuclease subunit